MNTATGLFTVRWLVPLLVLTGFSTGTTAQTAPAAAQAPIVSSDSGATPPAVVAPGPARKAPAKDATGASPPAVAGRWVNRIDMKTCPRGSTVYIDERDGGVKCWVDDK